MKYFAFFAAFEKDGVDSTYIRVDIFEDINNNSL